MSDLDVDNEEFKQYRETIKSLVKERAALRDTLRRTRFELRFEEGGQPSKKRPASEEEEKQTRVEEETHPREETHSREQTQVEEDPRIEEKKSRVEETDERLCHVDKRPRLVLDDGQMKRTRKLFSHLVGHLQKAKTCLERDSRQAELQIETTKRVQDRIQRERDNLRQKRLDSLRETEQQTLERLRRLQWELETNEMHCLRLQLITHYRYMQNFISTKAHPTVFWVPHIHTAKTRQMQSQTSQQIEKKIRSIREQLRPPTYEEYCQQNLE